MIYQNQDAVSRALKKVIPSVVSREELFITSKLWNTSHQSHLVEVELDETLRQLGLSYLDLYRMCVMHIVTLFTDDLQYSRPLARRLRTWKGSLRSQRAG